MTLEKLFGKQPVLEALKANKRQIKKIYLKREKQDKEIKQVYDLARRYKIKIKEVHNRKALDNLVKNTSHQGIVALVSPKRYIDINNLLNKSIKKNSQSFLLALDGIEDPRNLGSIIRTAETINVHGIIIPKHRAAHLNNVVAKTSAGAIEYIDISLVNNLASCLDLAKKKENLWIVGIDADAPVSIWETDLKRPLVLIIGGEGRGIRPLIKKKCDILASIPMQGKISSLNASVAAALSMYEIMRQRRNLISSN